MLTAARFAHAPCPSQARSAAANAGAALAPQHGDGCRDPGTLLASTGRRAFALEPGRHGHVWPGAFGDCGGGPVR